MSKRLADEREGSLNLLHTSLYTVLRLYPALVSKELRGNSRGIPFCAPAGHHACHVGVHDDQGPSQASSHWLVARRLRVYIGGNFRWWRATAF